uniref:Integrase, catalytic region, zinc finger, CCHC-type, peptidase aspartic, catalytic n=1 Tax=Tanacetum cinerariifolium TaxID=118510 RepID=A0A6L2JFR6_TANCI|nr:hypothetical protein [Tanacetum cinerariifolium]
MELYKKLMKGVRMVACLGKCNAIGIGVINTFGDVKANQPRVIKCYNYKGKAHIAKQCIAMKLVKDSEWIKEKMLLAQAQEARVILHEEQQDFLANGLENFDSDRDDLLLHTTLIFKAYHVDAFDLDDDEAPSTSEIFMARHSPAETKYSEQLVSNNDSYDELNSNNNVISNVEYMVTIENDASHSFPPPEQNNDNVMILSSHNEKIRKRGESNPVPLACNASALPYELHSHLEIAVKVKMQPGPKPNVQIASIMMKA